MSTPFNPYQPPKPEAQVVESYRAGAWKMNYFGGINYVMANPNWFMNSLLLLVCAIIPIIGPIILQGYTFETVELMQRTGQRRYWDFNFNRFGEYLSRGVAPFLIQLVFGLVHFFIVMVFYILSIVIAISLQGGGGDAGLLIFAVLLVMFILHFILHMMIATFEWTLMIRAGVSADIGQGFNFGWGWKFYSKCRTELYLAFLTWFVCLMAISLLSGITCGLGYLVAFGFITLINSWLSFNLYRVFLSRGGEPIPLKPLTPPLEMMLAQEAGQAKPQF
jgi:Protein of unknown function (DUF4013)